MCRGLLLCTTRWCRKKKWKRETKCTTRWCKKEKIGRRPSRVFKNHYSCKQFSQCVTETILQRIESGAIRVWGKWGEVAPPHLGLPMTIEPQKPRLCTDARFLNLWMVDTPFSRETLVVVPRFVYPNSCMSKIHSGNAFKA